VGGHEPPRRLEERPRALAPPEPAGPAERAGPLKRPGRPLIARVLPDIAGLDRELDYEVPGEIAEQLRVGSVVRVPLQGRRVRAWVTGFPPEAPAGVNLKPVQRVLGWGPEPEVVALAGWAAWRWAGRKRAALVSASAEKLVKRLSPPCRSGLPRRSGGGDDLGRWLVERSWQPGAHVLRLPPAASATGLVMAAAERGRVLVIAPTKARAEAGQVALAKRGVEAALLPCGWAQARAGAQVVIGARRAAWGPCPGMKSVVVLDAHDESLVQEQAPTWDAPTVAAERARRAGVPCFWVSPCPTLEMLTLAQGVALPSRSEEREGWSRVRVVDRRGQDPREGLISHELVQLLRAERRLVVCVLNRKGRASLLDCRACGELATCERCGAAVAMVGERLICRRCGEARPIVCSSCGSEALRSAKLGVSGVREHLQALTSGPVGEVAGQGGPVPDARVLVGTSALLYREEELRASGGVGAVAFLDFDQELLAPRYRAGEEALALLARASRLVRGRSGGGQVLVQTRLAAHPVIKAAVLADPGRLAEAERPLREQLRLPPFSALALISGPGAAQLVAALGRGAASRGSLELSELGTGRWVARAPSYEVLCDALGRAGRPAGRVRVEVGPVRF
jgi:primosomal protein N' (replication factor Y)